MTRRGPLLLSMVFLTAVCGPTLSQQSTASVEGTILEAVSGRPMGKTTVELRSTSSTGGVIASTQTNLDGGFYLREVAPGGYRLVAARPGHVTAEFGQRHPGGPGQTFTLAAGQRVTGVQVMMSPGAVISGRITDRGQAVALAETVAIRAISTEGRLSFTPVLATRTNDLGEYSLFWLPPGRYYILAIVWDSPNAAVHYVTPDGTDNNSYATQRFIGRAVFMRTPSSGIADNEAHVPIYYPGTSDPQLASAIEVSPGAEIRGINIDAGPVALGRVRGTVTGMPAASVDMRPLTWTIYTAPAQRPNGNVNSVGSFEMSAVPGRYTLTAFGSGMETFTIVDVRAGAVTNAVVSLSPGLTVHGRILIERASPVPPDPALPSLRVALRPDPLAPGVSSFVSSPLEADGSFTIPEGKDTGPPEGDFRVLVEPLLLPPTQPGATPRNIPASLENLYVKSIRMGDLEVLYDRLRLTSQAQGSLTIVIGTNPGTLGGRVLDDRDDPMAGTTVVLVHDNGLRFRVDEKVTSSDSAGRFEFRNVPPGAYKVFAWNYVEVGAWQDPEFMRRFENRGTSVRIEESERASLDVKVIKN
jgi:hypothetical protein